MSEIGSTPRPGATSAIPARLLAGVGVYLLVYLAWQAFGWGGEDKQQLIGDLAFVVPTALAAWAAWSAANRACAVPRIAMGWRLIALALASYLVGNGIQLWAEVAPGEPPFPSVVADIAYLALYPLFLVAVLRFPRVRRESRRRSLRTLIDAATVALGGATVIWYLVLGPTATSDTGNTLTTLVTLAYPAGDLVLIVALVRLLTEAIPGELRVPLKLLGAGVLMFIVADVVYSWTVLHGQYSGGHWIDALWLGAAMLFGLAAATQRGMRTIDVEHGAEASARVADVSYAPYLAVAAVFGLLIASQAHDAFFPGLSLSLIVIAVVVGVLVSVRQLLAQRDVLAAHEQLSEAHAELAKLATTDPLTGLPNHRAIVAAIDQELERSRRYERTCGVLFFDIDYFKALNDGSGHAAGDSVLRELGLVVREVVRTMDTVGRWGGEEFAVVLPEIDEDEAMVIAERVRAAVARHMFTAAAGIQVTISVGAASYPRDGESRSTVLAAADHAMYAAKHMGRNRAFSAADPAVTGFLTRDDSYCELNERTIMTAVDALAALVDPADERSRLAQPIALVLGCALQQVRRTSARRSPA